MELTDIALSLPSEQGGRLNRTIEALRLEPLAARLPQGLRFSLARRRYGWIDYLAELQTGRKGRQSLIEANALNAIFVHIPKTGGLSVAEGLFGNHAAAHTALYSYLALYGARRFDAMFKFAVVRNPWDRLVSAYQFMAAGGLTEADRTFAAAHMTRYAGLEDFVENGLSRPEILAWTHFKPQSLFLRDPRTGRLGVDYIGRFEQLSADYAAIAARLGVARPLPHKNKGAGGTKPGLSASAIDRIGVVYREDVLALNYAAPDPV